MTPIYRCSIVLVIQLFAANAVFADDKTLEQSAMDFQAARFAAMIDSDIQSLGEFLAEDLTYTHTTGWIETKSEFISTVESAVINYMSMEPSDVKVRLYGDVAIMTGLARMQGSVNDNVVEFTIRFTDVSRRVGDAWQLVAWHSVRMPED